MATDTRPLSHLADSILYLSSMLRDGARRIDFYIDHFGGTPGPVRPAGILTTSPGVAVAATASGGVASDWPTAAPDGQTAGPRHARRALNVGPCPPALHIPSLSRPV